jgi:hypothetical protein
VRPERANQEPAREFADRLPLFVIVTFLPLVTEKNQGREIPALSYAYTKSGKRIGLQRNGEVPEE